MNWESIAAALWSVVNSPVGVTVVAGAALWALNRVYASRPAWAKYEGAIISAVRFAEKQIPDDVETKGLARFDRALQYVLKVFEDVNGRRPKPREVADLSEGVRIVHHELDTDGALSGRGQEA